MMTRLHVLHEVTYTFELHSQGAAILEFIGLGAFLGRGDKFTSPIIILGFLSFCVNYRWYF
jgi:hypothetical protein